MPYNIGEKNSHGCNGFPVVNTETGKVMSCNTTEEQAKKHLAALYANVEDANKSADSFTPPKSVQNNAKRGLELRREFNRGGTEVGVARARSLSNGQGIPLETIRRMVSYFARHEVDKKGEDWGNASNPSAGYIAWLLWGGDAGKTWANSISEREKKKDKAMAITDNAYAYAQIIKQERLEDGTLMVYGKATDDSLDIDQQICDAAWLAKAMPEWFKSGGNIREQHSNIAAGVAKELDAKDDGFYINVHVVDPVSVKKTEAGVFKGFSVGIRSPRIVRDNKAANGRIIDGQIVEVSLVDRPANPNAKLIMAKSVGTEIVMVNELIEKSEEEVVETPVVETPVEETPAPVAEETVVETPVETVEETEEEKKKREEEEAANAAAPETVVEEAPVADETPSTTETVDEVDAEKTAAIFDKAKSINTDIVKFDKGMFDAARAALAQLIAMEAKEMEAGSDERYSLSMLVNAVHNLMCWYEGEEEEGEVMELAGAAMEMSADPTDKSALSDDAVESIIAKAVKSAKDAVSEEINVYKETINSLEDKLATALTKAVAGGPKRSATKPSSNEDANAFVLKAIEYRTKAANTTDKTLARGFRELAEDFDAKAKTLIAK